MYLFVVIKLNFPRLGREKRVVVGEEKLGAGGPLCREATLLHPPSAQLPGEGYSVGPWGEGPEPPLLGRT